MKHKLFIALLTLVSTSLIAAPTTSVLGGGICINEILADPYGAKNFDTDGNGRADAYDEFVTLYNSSDSIINIGGWELWDAGQKKWFTFPDGALLHPGNAALVMPGVQIGGSLPLVSGGNLAFDAKRVTNVINNNGDNMVLYDPNKDTYVQVRFGGDGADDPISDYAGFSSTATRVGPVEKWGAIRDGMPRVRFPNCDTTVIHHTRRGAPENASPGISVEPHSIVYY